MAISATVSGAINARQTKAADQGTASFPGTDSTSLSFTDGVAAGQADIYFSDTRTLALSTSENIDLSGVLTDIFGTSIVSAKIKAMKITAAAGNTNNVIVGGAGATAFVTPFGSNTDTITIKPGYFWMFGGTGTGYVVTAATGDILKVLNGGAGTSVTYTISFLATSS